jgi:hypothetical protein
MLLSLLAFIREVGEMFAVEANEAHEFAELACEIVSWSPISFNKIEAIVDI